MVKSAVLGFPRMGPNRELKKALEAHWAGKLSEAELQQVAKDVRLQNWKLQESQGLDIIPSNDFSFYDQVLDHSVLFNVIPKRYQDGKLSFMQRYFAMARGNSTLPSQEMVKWFDSNYHFMRPEFSNSTEFKLASTKPIDEFLEAKEANILTRPVVIGPVSFLYLGKPEKDSHGLDPISLIDKLLPAYEDLFRKLAAAGAEWIQVDEGAVVYDLPEKVRAAFKPAYERLSKAAKVKILFTTYFGDLGNNADIVKGLPVAGIHVDLVRAPGQLQSVLSSLRDDQILSAGVVDGRNIWKTNFKSATEMVETAIQKIGKDRVIVASSSSLLHTPHTLESEKKISEEIKDWFSFAAEKAKELSIIAKAVTDGPDSVRSEMNINAKSIEARKSSKITNDPAVRERQSKVTQDMHQRKTAFSVRYKEQRQRLKLPLFPTTTIGSFPQTKEIRLARNKYKKGEITEQEYDSFIEKEIQAVVKFQEEVGLDVLVHGEPERNDMVQYFGEQLNGFVFTQNAWVQSYGSRCVQPPLIVGDISRPKAMTVKESKYAQSITNKPMKAMLTGPVTILAWSFPRDDIPRSVQCQQLALALRDEILDLEKAGLKVIQVDEPALREACPLRKKDFPSYLEWAVDAFCLATAGVENDTQIHSHFCYSDFNEIFDAIRRLDADVVSIENSKSDLKLLSVFDSQNYPACIGPGIWDIHSPRVPPLEEIQDRVREILKRVPAESLWINPDCGLKTRNWEETEASLKNMVATARSAREEYKA